MLLFTCLACSDTGSDSPNGVDGQDAGFDAGTEAGEDAGFDAGVDAGDEVGDLGQDEDQIDGDDEMGDDGGTSGDGEGDGSEESDGDGNEESDGDPDGDGGGGDPGGYECEMLEPGADIGDDFGLLIPGEVQVCSNLKEMMPGDPVAEYLVRGRITFCEGLLRLPPGEEYFEAQWIRRFEFGPDKTVAEPGGPGQFSVIGTSVDYLFIFNQTYMIGGEQFQFDLRIIFDQGGERLYTLDEVMLADETRQRFKVDFAAGDYRYYYSCTMVEDTLGVHQAVVENQDRLYAELRSHDHFGAGNDRRASVIWAVFERGNERREVGDPFRTAFSASLHLSYPAYLVVFDVPVDDAYAILVGGASDFPAAQIEYLDADLNLIEVRGFESYVISK